MTCGSCHDVHGSSNYRLLKDVVNGVDVGGYVETAGGDFLPDPYVISNEPGYPEDGWLLHDAGAAQIEAYEPSYTTPMYAKAPDEDPDKGISAWCAACHTRYHGTWAEPVRRRRRSRRRHALPSPGERPAQRLPRALARSTSRT